MSFWRPLSCAIWGHHVDNHTLAAGPAARACRCGQAYLDQAGRITRVRHTLSCFLGRHSYEPLVDRHGSREYVCVQCGHPLVFRDERDPYRQQTQFRKKVRYLCGLLGHRVEAVTARDGLVEYACHCGHTFLKAEDDRTTIRHPLVCVLLGHYVRFVTARGRFDEFLCVNCGHPFCFAQGEADWASDEATRGFRLQPEERRRLMTSA
jgi:hypothetical protein